MRWPPLQAPPKHSGGLFCRTGESSPRTVTGYWRSRLARVAEASGVRGFHPHRLRDTVAVNLLTADVDMQDLSTLLGHSNTPPDGKLRSRDQANRTSSG